MSLAMAPALVNHRGEETPTPIPTSAAAPPPPTAVPEPSPNVTRAIGQSSACHFHWRRENENETELTANTGSISQLPPWLLQQIGGAPAVESNEIPVKARVLVNITENKEVTMQVDVGSDERPLNVTQGEDPMVSCSKRYHFRKRREKAVQ